MAIEVLAVGSTAATSDEQVVALGVVATVFLQASTPPYVHQDAHVDIQFKASDGTFHTVGVLYGYGEGQVAVSFTGPVTYRAVRAARVDKFGTAVSCGVQQG